MDFCDFLEPSLTMSEKYLLTGSNLEGAALLVHGEVLQVHDAGGHDGESLRVEHSTIGKQSRNYRVIL